MNQKEFSLASGAVAAVFFTLAVIGFMGAEAEVIGNLKFHISVGVMFTFVSWLFNPREKSGETEVLDAGG